MTSETKTLKEMYFQLLESQVLSTQGQPDVNLLRLTSSLFVIIPRLRGGAYTVVLDLIHECAFRDVGAQAQTKQGSN